MDIPLTVLSYLGIAQALILALLYFIGYGKHKRNFGLGSLFLLLTLAMITILLTNTMETGFHELLLHIEYALTFCAGPVLLIVAHNLRRDSVLHPASLGLHFAPAILYAGASILMAFSGRPLSVPILIPIVHMQAYTAWLIFTMRQRSRSKDFHFNQSGHGWLKLLSIMLISLHASQWIRIAFPDAGYTEYLVPVTAFSAMYGLMIFGFLNATLYSEGRYSAQRPGNADLIKQLQLLEKKMNDYELYKNKSLTLDMLAAKVEISPNEISHIINKGLNKNFNEWINQYRVNLVKQMLVDTANQHLTIDALAEEAGFNSRSSFYDAFKKLTGTTPTSHRNNY